MFIYPLVSVRRPPWLSQTGAGAQGRRQLFVAGLPVWLGPPSNEQDRGGRVFGWHLFGVCGAGCLPFFPGFICGKPIPYPNFVWMVDHLGLPSDRIFLLSPTKV